MLSISTSPFLQRLVALLKHCCATLGVEETSARLLLPVTIGTVLAGNNYEEANSTDDELADCRSLEHTAVATPVVEEKRDSEAVLQLTDEAKRSALLMYHKGVKLQYIAGLFDIINPRVINCWGDWKRRPKFEAEKNIEKRAQIRDMLDRGESPKAIRTALRLTERAYLNLIGVPLCYSFPRSVYDAAMQQLERYNSRRIVSRNLKVPVYFLRRWVAGKGVPEKALLESDGEGSVEAKRKAIAKFYETGSAPTAAKLVGAPTPQVVERWVVTYQQAADELEKADSQSFPA